MNKSKPKGIDESLKVGKFAIERNINGLYKDKVFNGLISIKKLYNQYVNEASKIEEYYLSQNKDFNIDNRYSYLIRNAKKIEFVQ